MAHRQPLLLVHSCKGIQKPMVVIGFVYRKVESWWGTTRPMKGGGKIDKFFVLKKKMHTYSPSSPVFSACCLAPYYLFGIFHLFFPFPFSFHYSLFLHHTLRRCMITCCFVQQTSDAGLLEDEHALRNDGVCKAEGLCDCLQQKKKRRIDEKNI